MRDQPLCPGPVGEPPEKRTFINEPTIDCPKTVDMSEHWLSRSVDLALAHHRSFSRRATVRIALAIHTIEMIPKSMILTLPMSQRFYLYLSSQRIQQLFCFNLYTIISACIMHVKHVEIILRFYYL